MKVLVAVASRYGSTWEIGRAIGAAIREQGIRATVMRVEDVESLELYDAVILGSAAYSGRWVRPALNFIDIFADDLKKRDVWLFSSGPLGSSRLAKGTAEIAEVMLLTGAKGYHQFAGKLDKKHLSLTERVITMALHAPEGDYRDWDEITEWGTRIGQELSVHEA